MEARIRLFGHDAQSLPQGAQTICAVLPMGANVEFMVVMFNIKFLDMMFEGSGTAFRCSVIAKLNISVWWTICFTIFVSIYWNVLDTIADD